MTKFNFYGTLANGTTGLVVALWLPGIQEAYRVMKAHANIRSFKPAEDQSGYIEGHS